MSDDLSGGAPDDATRWEALARYLAGESPAGEAEAIRRHLLEDPAAAELFRVLADRRLVGAPDSGEVDVERALHRVRARMAAAEAQGERAPALGGARARAFARPSTTWRIAGLAAAAVVALVAGALYRRAALRRGEAPPLSAERTFTSAVGARDSIALVDGSRVLLGPGSLLTVAAGYGSANRNVEVTGEAYFDVHHDAAHPFTVRAAGATIRDLGTTFAVHDDASGEVRVAVTTGSVLLRSAAAGDSGVVLHRGDAGLVRDGAPALARAGAATADDLAWREGRLVFRDATVTDVAADLRRWYGVELQTPDSALARRHITATFSGEPVRRVVQVVGLALGAEVEWHGDTAVIRR